jgi:hypothetical protein
VLYYSLLNAGYYMWDGGAAFGPRHCVPMLPFLALGLVVPLRLLPRATLVLAGVGVFHVVLVTTVGPEAPTWGNPVWEYGLPGLLEGPGGPGAASTLGRLMGLPGPFALVPLAAIWVLVVARPRAQTSQEAQTTLT